MKTLTEIKMKFEWVHARSDTSEESTSDTDDIWKVNSVEWK